MIETLLITNTVKDIDDPVKGTKALGYYGQVAAADFINGDALGSLVGVTTAGRQVSINSPWLKFAFKNKVLYVAKQPLINLVSWDQLNAAGVVTGKIVMIGQKRYRVRLLLGVNNSDTGEWNNLMYRVHTSDPTGTKWETFSNADLYVGVGNGRTSICQELDAARRMIYRGYASLTDFAWGGTNSATATTGWRPVLEEL